MTNTTDSNTLVTNTMDGDFLLDSDLGLQLDLTPPHNFTLSASYPDDFAKHREVSRYYDNTFSQSLKLSRFFCSISRHVAAIADFDEIHGFTDLPAKFRSVFRREWLQSGPDALLEVVKEVNGEEHAIEISDMSLDIGPPDFKVCFNAKREKRLPEEVEREKDEAMKRFLPGDMRYPLQQEWDEQYRNRVSAIPMYCTTHTDMGAVFGKRVVRWIDDMMTEFIYRVYVNRMIAHRLRVEQKVLERRHATTGQMIAVPMT